MGKKAQWGQLGIQQVGRGWLGTQDSSQPLLPSSPSFFPACLPFFPPSPVLQGHGEERDNMTLSESGKVNRVECFVTCSSRPGKSSPALPWAQRGKVTLGETRAL